MTPAIGDAAAVMDRTVDGTGSVGSIVRAVAAAVAGGTLTPAGLGSGCVGSMDAMDVGITLAGTGCWGRRT